LSTFDPRIRTGERVFRNQEIGESGNTGTSTGPHLHFEIRKGPSTQNARLLPELDPTSLFTRNERGPNNPAPSITRYKNTPECKYCAEVAKVKNDIVQQQEQQARADKVIRAADAAVRKFNNLSAFLRYHEILPDIMVSRIARDSNEERSNAFGAAPGTLSIKANLTLPGIAGLRVGELFWIDRIPLFYRAFGAFQTMTIEDNISLQGWTTKIDARFNYLGNGWKRAVVRLFEQSDQETPE
jgi:hypothetical protein